MISRLTLSGASTNMTWDPDGMVQGSQIMLAPWDLNPLEGLLDIVGLEAEVVQAETWVSRTGHRVLALSLSGNGEQGLTVPAPRCGRWCWTAA